MLISWLKFNIKYYSLLVNYLYWLCHRNIQILPRRQSFSQVWDNLSMLRIKHLPHFSHLWLLELTKWGSFVLFTKSIALFLLRYSIICVLWFLRVNTSKHFSIVLINLFKINCSPYFHSVFYPSAQRLSLFGLELEFSRWFANP